MDKKDIRTLYVLIGFAIVATWGLFRPEALAVVFQLVISIVTPFVFGLGIAFILNLLVGPVERAWEWIFRRKPEGRLRKLKRPASIFLSVGIIAAAMFVLLFIVIPEVVGTFVLVVDMLPQFMVRVNSWWEQLGTALAAYGVVLPELSVNMEEIRHMVTGWVTERGPAVLGKTLGFTTSIVVGAFNVAIGFVFALYMLAEKERLSRQFKKVLFAFLPEEKAKGVIDVVQLTHSTLTKFVTGQVTDAFIVGVLCFIGMLAFSMPYAGAVSVLVGATTMIPVIGVLMGTVVGAFLILVVDPMKALWFIVFIIVLQQVESNVIYPKVVGKSVGLPGIWVLVGITIGGTTFGILGMLLGVPLCSVIYTLLKQNVNRRLEESTIK